MSVKHKESGIHLLPYQRLWKESSASDDKYGDKYGKVLDFLYACLAAMAR